MKLTVPIPCKEAMEESSLISFPRTATLLRMILHQCHLGFPHLLQLLPNLLPLLKCLLEMPFLLSLHWTTAQPTWVHTVLRLTSLKHCCIALEPIMILKVFGIKSKPSFHGFTQVDPSLNLTKLGSNSVFRADTNLSARMCLP